jgi:hypothetical protein
MMLQRMARRETGHREAGADGAEQHLNHVAPAEAVCVRMRRLHGQELLLG